MMRFKNSTDFPEHFLKRMLRWCLKEVGVSSRALSEVRFTGCSRQFRGRAFWGRKTKRILVRIGGPHWFPCSPYKSRGVEFPEMDRVATLIHVTAHELMHVWLWNEKADKRDREHRCEHAALQCIAAFHANRSSLLAEWNSEPVRRTTKPALSISEKRHAKVIVDLVRWQRKAKLAATKIKKLKQRQRYYERKQAAKGSSD